MDAVTADAIAQLSGRIDSLEASLREEFRTGFGGQRRHTDSKFEQGLLHTDSKFDDARRHTDSKFADAQRHTDEKFAEARRHAEVLTESVRDDIRIVAEGLATLIVKVDALKR